MYGLDAYVRAQPLAHPPWSVMASRPTAETRPRSRPLCLGDEWPA